VSHLDRKASGNVDHFAGQRVNETPDSVRLAWPAEAGAIAAIQRRAWSDRPDELGGLLLDAITLDQMTDAWESAIARPPNARCRVLVAVQQSQVVGFATTVPGDDPDVAGTSVGELAELEVDPPARGAGHGSRLLNACVDTLRADGFRRAVSWVAVADDVRRRFLQDAGWATDGSRREIGPEDGDQRLEQLRLHTEIGDG
jgi:GNAT superfamily N-acetyltransferase